MPKLLTLALPTLALKDPRVGVRAALGVLLLANLVAAVILFKPFGGSAEDLLRQQQALRAQLSQLDSRIGNTRKLVAKVNGAREAGDAFLGQYFIDEPTASSTILAELMATAISAGVNMGQAQLNREPIEGSDTLTLQTIQVGFEGNYANLTKFINQLDKSPRFLIIENLQAAAPQQQGGQRITVTLKIDCFLRESARSVLSQVAGAQP
jgi:Tfp pilus assembly protein PilO